MKMLKLCIFFSFFEVFLQSSIFLFRHNRSCCLNFKGYIVCNEGVACSGGVCLDFNGIVDFINFNLIDNVEPRYNKILEEIINFNKFSQLCYGDFQDGLEQERLIKANKTKQREKIAAKVGSDNKENKESIVFAKLVQLGLAKRYK